MSQITKTKRTGQMMRYGILDSLFSPKKAINESVTQHNNVMKMLNDQIDNTQKSLDKMRKKPRFQTVKPRSRQAGIFSQNKRSRMVLDRSQDGLSQGSISAVSHHNRGKSSVNLKHRIGSNNSNTLGFSKQRRNSKMSSNMSVSHDDRESTKVEKPNPKHQQAQEIMNSWKPSIDRMVKTQGLYRKIQSPVLDLPKFSELAADQEFSKSKL